MTWQVVLRRHPPLPADPGIAILLTGPAGTGKTALAETLLESHRAKGRTILSMVGIAELTEVPLAALATVFPAVAKDLQRPGGTRELIATIGARPELYALLADDAPFIDDHSAAVILQLVKVFGIPTILTARDGARLPGPLRRLISEGLVTSVPVPPLTEEETAAALRTNLGGPVEPRTVAALYERTAGNPLHLRSLVEAALRSGGVRSRPRAGSVPSASGIEDEFRLAIPDTPSSLLDAVADALPLEDPTLMRGARLIAVAQPVPSDALDHLDPALDSAMLRLIDLGVLSREAWRDSSFVLRVRHPLYTETLLRDAPPAELRTLREEAARALRAVDSPALRLHAVRLLRIAGADLADDEVIWAASAAYSFGDLELCLDLAACAISLPMSQVASIRLRVDRASALSLLGDVEDASREFDELSGAASAHTADHSNASDSASSDDVGMSLRGDGDLPPDLAALLAMRHADHLAHRCANLPAAVDRLAETVAVLPADLSELLSPTLAGWRAALGAPGGGGGAKGAEGAEGAEGAGADASTGAGDGAEGAATAGSANAAVQSGAISVHAPLAPGNGPDAPGGELLTGTAPTAESPSSGAAADTTLAGTPEVAGTPESANATDTADAARAAGEHHAALLTQHAIGEIMNASMELRVEGAGHAARLLRDLGRAYGAQAPHAEVMVGLQRYFELLASGQGAAAYRVAASQRAGEHVDAAGIWTYTAAVHSQYDGNVARASDLADLALTQLQWRDHLGLLSAARALRVLVTTLSGDDAAATTALAAIPKDDRSDPKAMMLFAEAEAWLLARRGDTVAAAEVIRTAASAAIAGGHALVGSISLGMCLRMGQAQVADEVLSAIPDFPAAGLLVALRDLTTAHLTGNVTHIAAASRALATCGMGATARDALAHVDPSSLTTTETRVIADLRAELDGPRDGAWLSPMPELSPATVLGLQGRHLEVARLAARRLSSKEIAAALGISSRTVDNHLGAVYRALGIASRGELWALREDLDSV